MKKWQEYERLITSFYKEVLHADIKHNDKIMGSVNQRQIDVSIRHKIAGHEILMIVQAKCQKKPVTMGQISEFESVIRDVKASKGIMFCNAGFTKSVKDYAKNKGIELCTVYDTESRDWKRDIAVPILRINYIPNIKINYGCFFKVGDSIKDASKLVFSCDKGKTKIDPVGIFVRLWNDNSLPGKEVERQYVLPLEDLDFFLLVKDKKGKIQWRPVRNFRLTYNIEQKVYLKYFQSSEFKGIKNELSGNVKVANLKINLPSCYLDGGWEPINNPRELAIHIDFNFEIVEYPVLSREALRYSDISLYKRNPT